MSNNKIQLEIFGKWEKHLKNKNEKEYRKILSYDEEMAKAATEFYSVLGEEFRNHLSLETMIKIAVEQRQKIMKKASAQKKTFGKVIKKGSSDFSDLDLSIYNV